jgi:hypothetical protein
LSDRQRHICEEGLVSETPEPKVRRGWAQASQALAEFEDDALVWPEFTTEEDEAVFAK